MADVHRRRIALVTCAALPELDPDDQLLIEPLRALGAAVSTPVWDDPSIDWTAFDLVVIRDTWDYAERRTDFVSWARRVPRLANPADIIEWNTDKRYLGDLARAGIPVVPTVWIEPGGEIALPSAGRHVLKPSVGAGSIDAAAFTLHDEHEARLARQHAERLLGNDRTVMLQPYMGSVDESGETGLLFLGGEFSHAFVKGPMLVGDHGLEEDGLYMSESIAAREPGRAELDLAAQALAAVPGGPERLLYARVDLVPDANGQAVLIELELTEPSFFMGTAPGAERRAAEAIMAAAHASATAADK